MLIYLIGYMGCGKTTLGPRLARLLNYDWLDLDQYIELKYHISIPGIFEKYGEKNFRSIEKKALHDTFDLKNTVISTGGGTPCFFDNIKLMKQNGVVVYIKLSAGMLSDRLFSSKKPRPLLRTISNEDLKITIEEQLQQRNPFYEKAHIILTHNHATAPKLAEFIRLYQSGGLFT